MAEQQPRSDSANREAALAEALDRYDRFAHDLIREAISADLDRDLIDRGLLLRTRYVGTVGVAREVLRAAR